MAIIDRDITQRLTDLCDQHPFVTVTGPRQSGKTTLCRTAFPDRAHADLAVPHDRDFAASNPKRFLARLGDGAIIEEVQRVPQLLSCLQAAADGRGHNGGFVLTASEHPGLSPAFSQSLAGSTAQLHLLPFSLAERRRVSGDAGVDDILYAGCYPRIVDQGLDPTRALADYFETYVERDVRRIGEIRNPSAFERFVRLCAGRVGQMVNASSLGSGAGVSHTTAREWLRILETTYIIFQLPPHHADINRRLVKSPKLYFWDVGLAAYLIGIENAGQMAAHPQRGALFENAVVADALKHRLNRGHPPDLKFFRDAKGLECPLLYPAARGIAAIEVSPAPTIDPDGFRSLQRVGRLIPDISSKIVVYGGMDRETLSGGGNAVPLGELDSVLGRLEDGLEMDSFGDGNPQTPPDRVDVPALITAYQRHIGPTLDGLEAALGEWSAGVFRGFRETSHVILGGEVISSSYYLGPGEWERCAEKAVAEDRTPLEVENWYTFLDYIGQDGAGLAIALHVHWRLDRAGVSRTVEIRGSRGPELESQMSWAELVHRNPEVPRLVAEIPRRIMRRVGELTAVSGTGSSR